MEITMQNGDVVNAYNIELSGKTIKCTPNHDKRLRIECGTYQSRERATEIFSEMTCEGWNNKNPKYIMPKA